jgi:hypothetical protein
MAHQVQSHPPSRSPHHGRPSSRSMMDKANITYGEMSTPEECEAIPCGMFQNRRKQDPYLNNVFPGGFVPQRGVNPPKYKHFSEKFNEEGVREYIPVVSRPHTYQMRARSPSPPHSPLKDVGDEFRHVAGPYFKQLEIDDSVQFGMTSVINLESTSMLSSETKKSGSFPCLPTHGRILRTTHTGKVRSFMQPKSPGVLVTGTPTTKMLANLKLSPGASLGMDSDNNSVLREVLSYQSQNLALTVSLYRLEDALESDKAVSQATPAHTAKVTFEYPFFAIQKLVASMVAHDSRAKNKKGKFSIDMKFYKEADETWIPMNSELQWIHAKSCALDNPLNSVKVMYGALNQSDIVRPPKAGSAAMQASQYEEHQLLLELRSKLDVDLNLGLRGVNNGLDSKHSFQSIDTDGSAGGNKFVGANTSLLFTDSITSQRSGHQAPEIPKKGHTLSAQKQNLMAKNLEKRLVQKVKK